MSRPNPMRAVSRSRPSTSQCASCSPRPLPLLSPRQTTSQSYTLPSQSLQYRSIHSTGHRARAAQPPSKPGQNNSQKTSQTDIAELDVLGTAPVPSTNIEATLARGFLLNSGLGIFDGAGALLVGGEAFAWRPWLANTKGTEEENLTLVNAKGQIELPAQAFSALSLLWPRPDLLVLGVGPAIRPLSPETRKYISDLGMRVEVLDTRNAAAQFNLLATERGVEDIAGALIPIGWVDGKGAVE